jgi:phosphatidylglycerophosphatase A
MSEPQNHIAPKWAWWIATGFGSGRLRPAPGTWGSLAALAAWFTLAYFIQPLPGLASDCVLGFLALLMIFASIFASGLVVRQVGIKDPSYIVSDEWAGMWLALWPARQGVYEAINGGDWKLAIVSMFAAFLFFRMFDIWKPWPIRKLESLPGGWGVTLDDVLAGVYAGLAVYCAMLLYGIKM